MFRFGAGSLNNLITVEPWLQSVCHYAIGVTPVDFGCIEGLRDLDTQKEYVRIGASQTMNSKHLIGHAVDLMAYYNGKATWESTWYDEIAGAMVEGAKNTPHKKFKRLRWGGAWHIPDITKYKGTMQEATEEYIALRISQGKKPFLDYPHFEIA